MSKKKSVTAVVSSVLVRRLVRKYEGLRAKHYRKAIRYTKRNDIAGQLISATFQTAFTEIQVDLEKLLPPNEKADLPPTGARQPRSGTETTNGG